MSDFKRKKKKSFMQRAKKFGKQGKFGKGKQLSEEEYHFFIKVMQHIRDPEFEEKDLVIRNFFRQFEGENKKELIKNQIVSRILDDVLPLAPLKSIFLLMNIISEDLRIYCTDPFASHLVQTLLSLAVKYSQEEACIETKNEETSEMESVIISSEDKESFTSFLTKVTKFVYNNLEEFVCETYASHILRTVLEVCSGVEVSHQVTSSQKSQIVHTVKTDSKKVLKVSTQMLHPLVMRLTQISNFIDIVYSDSGSAVLQTALLVLSSLRNEEECTILIDHINAKGFNVLTDEIPNDQIHPLFEYNSTSRLLEVVISASSIKQQENLWNLYFNGKISELVKHRLGNFVVQRLLTSWKQKESFVMLYDAVWPCLPQAIEMGNTGVAFASVEACRKLGTHQSRCIKNLMEILKCLQSDTLQLKFVPCLLYFVPLPTYEEMKSNNSMTKPISLHGALIIQEFLQFNKPIKVVNSILEMNMSELQTMSCDPKGSHVIDSFMESPHVGDKNRDKLIHKFKGCFSMLACGKHGSRSLEAMWNMSSVKLKTLICNELLDSSDRILDNQFGKILYTKFQVRLFKRNDKSDWEELQAKQQKKRMFLKEFINDNDMDSEEPKTKKKKKNKSSSLQYLIDVEGDPIT